MNIVKNSFKVNDLKNPFIDSTPYFSWKIESEGTKAVQTSYKIVVKNSYGEKVWEAKEKSCENHAIYMDDSVLEPIEKYTCELKITADDGSSDSTKTFFFTGKRDSEWDAKWITGYNCYKRDNVLGAPYLRKEFSLTKKVALATLHICGLGYFVCKLNGNRVNDDYLSTPFTDYDKHTMYRSFDVTSILSKENAIAVFLGNGFYNCFTDDPWQTRFARWRDVPKMICELHIVYKDGTKEIICSDRSWESSNGPITFNGIRHGEQYDARLELDGFDMPNYDHKTGEWHPVRMVRPVGGVLIEAELEPIRIRYEFPAIKMWQDGEKTLFDIGQNQAGVCRLTLRGKTGDQITIRYCDLLDKENHLNQTPLACFIKNYTFQTEIYTKKSDEDEVWHSEFTYHGYQYVEISGGDPNRKLSDVVALALCNDYEDRGNISTSDTIINQVQHMCRYSVTSCSINTLASDAVREKSSWTGDTGFSSEEVLINFATDKLMDKWMLDARDSQNISGSIPCIVPSPGWGYTSLNGPDWSSALVDVPNYLYLYTGDKRYLKENYETLVRHCHFITSMSDGNTCRYGLGDWCAPFEGPALSVNMSSYKCPLEVSDTAYYHSAVLTLARWSEILGKKKDAKKYYEKAKAIKAAFREKFFDKENYLVKGDCQTATGMMIYHNLAEKDEIIPLLKTLKRQIDEKDGHLDFGVLGTKAVLNALGKYGMADIGISMLINPTFPSCKRWIDLGANTMWECWNGEGSHNHHMFSDISSFFYKYLGGISIDENNPGYKHINLRPGVKSNVKEVKSSIETPYGLAISNYSKTSKHAMLEIVVPSGSYATLYLPLTTENIISKKKDLISSISEKNNLVDCLNFKVDGEFICIDLTNGEYVFEIK